ncbi:MAG: hypothetical protein AAFP96_09395, partial [Bacteroidota bacterium]
MDSKTRTTPRKFLKTLTLLHMALCTGPIAVGLIFYYSTPIKEYKETAGDFFIYVFPLLGLIGVLASAFMFKTLTKNIADKSSLQEKLASFQSASLIRYALLEGPALLNLV